MQTPLHLAVITNQARVAQLLLDHNCDPSRTDPHGNTATHLAALYGHHMCLESMLPRDSHKSLATTFTTQIFPQLNMRNFDGESYRMLSTNVTDKFYVIMHANMPPDFIGQVVSLFRIRFLKLH